MEYVNRQTLQGDKYTSKDLNDQRFKWLFDFSLYVLESQSPITQLALFFNPVKDNYWKVIVIQIMIHLCKSQPLAELQWIVAITEKWCIGACLSVCKNFCNELLGPLKVRGTCYISDWLSYKELYYLDITEYSFHFVQLFVTSIALKVTSISVTVPF